MKALLGKPIAEIRDGENNPIDYDIAYAVKTDLSSAIDEIRRLHGEQTRLLAISGASCGGGIFQQSDDSEDPVVGLRLDPPAAARVSLASLPELTELALDEIVIDRSQCLVAMGAAITLEQLNQALATTLGQSYKVPGADLTSYQYAAVGATFMTGGMGPQRRYFSDSAIAAAIYDGRQTRLIETEALGAYAGTYGWSGIVSALICRYRCFPENEIAFALPVSGAAEELARLLARLAPYCYLDLESTPVTSSNGQSSVILGIEHVSASSMQPLLRDSADNPITARARDLQQKTLAAATDGLVFVSGYSSAYTDEFLGLLIDDETDESMSIAGVAVEHAEIFKDPELMRAVREAIPYAARMQIPEGKLLYKNHSDANIRLPAGEVNAVAAEVWRINCDYVQDLQSYFDEHREISGEVLVYGHLNPYGVDPHNRVTLSADDGVAFARARDFLIDRRARFYRQLAQLCHSGAAEFIGGEKTADSEIGIFRAIGGPEQAPEALRERFQRQCRTVRAADHCLNWRALQPYV